MVIDDCYHYTNVYIRNLLSIRTMGQHFNWGLNYMKFMLTQKEHKSGFWRLHIRTFYICLALYNIIIGFPSIA